MARKKHAALSPKLRREIKELISREYQSIDAFHRATGVNKSTLSRILSGDRNDCMVSTLGQIATGLGKRLTIRLD